MNIDGEGNHPYLIYFCLFPRVTTEYTYASADYTQNNPVKKYMWWYRAQIDFNKLKLWNITEVCISINKMSRVRWCAWLQIVIFPDIWSYSYHIRISGLQNIQSVCSYSIITSINWYNRIQYCTKWYLCLSNWVGANGYRSWGKYDLYLIGLPQILWILMPGEVTTDLAIDGWHWEWWQLSDDWWLPEKRCIRQNNLRGILDFFRKESFQGECFCSVCNWSIHFIWQKQYQSCFHIPICAIHCIP